MLHDRLVAYEVFVSGITRAIAFPAILPVLCLLTHFTLPI
jgi:hypothetical protein